MGVNLIIYVHRKDLERLLDTGSRWPCWDDFQFLVGYSSIRWHAFCREFYLEDYGEKDINREGITSKELLVHLASTSGKIGNRARWAEILSRYDLLFAPDTKEDIEKDWLCIGDIDLGIKRMTADNLEKVIEFCEQERRHQRFTGNLETSRA